MQHETPEFIAVLARLDKLERQNRRLKRAGAVALIAVAAIVLMGQAAPKSRIVEAEKFVLRDAKQRVRARLETDENSSPALHLYDKESNRRVSLYLTEDGEPVMSLRNARGKPQAELGLNADVARFSLRSPKVNGGVTVEVGTEGSGLLMYGPDGLRVGLTDGHVKPFELDFEPDGKPIAVRDWGLEGPALMLFDPQRYSTKIGVTSLLMPDSGETRTTSAASMIMFDKDNKLLWRAP